MLRSVRLQRALGRIKYMKPDSHRLT